MSFTDGFRTGFGLVNQVQDRQLKERRLEEDMKYRSETDAATADYRARDLDIKEKTQDSTDKLNTYRAETSRITADNQSVAAGTARINAQTAATKEKNLTNPDSIEYKEGLSEIDKNKAQQENYQSQADERNQEIDRIESAERLQRIYDLSLAAKTNGLGPEQYTEVADLINQNNDQSFFNVGYLINPQTARSMAMVETYYQDVAAGTAGEMSAELRAAFGAALGLNQSAALGRVIDESFTNAPDWMKGKGLTISGQGLHQVGVGNDGKLSGSLYVLAQDDDGNLYPYFPPLTANRNFASNEPLNFDLGDTVKATAGIAHMTQKIGPAIQREVREAMIHTKFGNQKDFESAVTAELDLIRKGIQLGASQKDSILVASMINSGVQAATQPEQLSHTKTLEFKRLVEHDMLFGPSDDTSEQFKIQDWFEDTSSALSDAPLPKAIKAKNLGELMSRSKLEFNYQNASVLQGYYDENGNIEDAAGLIDQLKVLNLL